MAGRWGADPGSRLAVLRRQCHREFDVFWKTGTMGRRKAYGKLAKDMGVSMQDCHFGMFDADQCERALDVIRTWLK